MFDVMTQEKPPSHKDVKPVMQETVYVWGEVIDGIPLFAGLNGKLNPNLDKAYAMHDANFDVPFADIINGKGFSPLEVTIAAYEEDVQTSRGDVIGEWRDYIVIMRPTNAQGQTIANSEPVIARADGKHLRTPKVGGVSSVPATRTLHAARAMPQPVAIQEPFDKAAPAAWGAAGWQEAKGHRPQILRRVLWIAPAQG